MVGASSRKFEGTRCYGATRMNLRTSKTSRIDDGYGIGCEAIRGCWRAAEEHSARSRMVFRNVGVNRRAHIARETSTCAEDVSSTSVAADAWTTLWEATFGYASGANTSSRVGISTWLHWLCECGVGGNSGVEEVVREFAGSNVECGSQTHADGVEAILDGYAGEPRGTAQAFAHYSGTNRGRRFARRWCSCKPRVANFRGGRGQLQQDRRGIGRGRVDPRDIRIKGLSTSVQHPRVARLRFAGRLSGAERLMRARSTDRHREATACSRL